MTNEHQFCLAIAATFTAEPLEQSLSFWLDELGFASYIEFAPYNQIYQQLLDPNSLLSKNQNGVNLILIRTEDWLGTQEQEIYRNIEDFVNLLQGSLERSKASHIVAICPSSPSKQSQLEIANETLYKKLQNLSKLYLVTNRDLELYPVEEYYDQLRDELGHIPFTLEFFTALGTVISRKIYSLKSSPHKVIVLDCDNTLWQGVVGEEGFEGIQITPEYRELQKLMLQQKQAGMLLSICSKNTETDVLEVFKKRQDLELKLDDFVNWKVNWQPKSENLKNLAQELNLGLDSFIFIDDNPLECDEVRRNAPEILSLNLPLESNIVDFLRHVWALDHLKITEEDKQRTKLYQQNIQRDRFQKETTSLDDFLSGLQLEIDINEPNEDQLARVAQLTQRTNQFNFSTRRYLETEITEQLQGSLDCRIVQVRDRFGDYGLVGVILFEKQVDHLLIDTFLLSCRVLGRGVEHKMLQSLALIAQQANLSIVKAPYIKTAKNLPALNFLEQFDPTYCKKTENGAEFVFPVESIIDLSYCSNQNSSNNLSLEQTAEPKQITSKPQQQSLDKNKFINKVARELNQVKLIQEHLQGQKNYTRPRNIDTLYAPATTYTERQLAKIWSEVLKVESIGLDDNYFDLGGTSLQSVELFAQVEKAFLTRLPLTSLVTAPTLREMSQLLNQTGQLSNDSCLVLLNQGDTYPPLFLIHDGNGETLLYRNLALNLNPKRTVYGLQPLSSPGYPILHTRIEDMAKCYLKQIKTIQPEGPYLLGGMCAGGVIAFEMSLQLQQKNEQVAMLAIIDAANVGTSLKKSFQTKKGLDDIFSKLNENKQSSLINKLFYSVNILAKKIVGFTAYHLSTLDLKWELTKLKLFDYCVSRKITPPAFLKGLEVTKVYTFAERNYIASTLPYNNDVLLFLGTEGVGVDTPFSQIYDDPLLGWSKRVLGQVKAVNVPGGHSSSLQEPNVAVMAKEIQEYLEQNELI
jgi:FkbH-like protein